MRCVSAEDRTSATCRRVPQMYGLIEAGRSQRRAIRAPGDRQNLRRVTSIAPDLFSGGSVPDSYRLVSRRAGQLPAIGTPGHTEDRVRKILNDLQDLT